MARILCIDDEVDFRGALAEFLLAWGHEVIEADNGVDGLAAALDDRPSLIICDRMMPRLSGFELLQSLRADHRWAAEIPFIFLTALSDARDRRSAADLEPAAYITKPVSFRSLRTTINRLVGERYDH